VYAASVNGLMCVLRCLEFRSLFVDTDVWSVHAIGADSHVSSCLGSIFLLAFFGRLTDRVLICCSLLVSMLR
jgi:hypothetical protein